MKFLYEQSFRSKFETKISGCLRSPKDFLKMFILKNLIAQPYFDSNSIPFRVFTRPLCSIYGQKIIEILGAHPGRFSRQSVSSHLSHRVELISIHSQLMTSYWFDRLRFIQTAKFELCPIFFCNKLISYAE
jgi:hypothetical protein